MKLVFLSAAGLAINAQEMNMNIAFKLQNAASQLTSNLLDNQAFASSVLTHGCWCAKLSPEIQMPGLGGYTPVDELDQICKDWAKARRCSRAQTCADQKMDGAYALDAVTYSNPDCVDSDVCLSETCQIDMFYMEKIEEFHSQNPNHVAVTDPTCQHKAVSNSLVCEPFVTTARPTTIGTTTTTLNQAVDDAINNIMGPSTCTDAADCISFSLYWENRVDIQSELDMWVTEPSGEKIGWSHSTSATGGKLDYDGGWGDYQAVENIQWTSNPPVGTYNVQVHNYNSALVSTGQTCTTANPCPDIPIFVRVVANGVTTVFEFDLNSNTDDSWSGGSVYEGDYINLDVYTFEYTSATRGNAATMTYTGPGIDYSKRHSYEQ